MIKNYVCEKCDHQFVCSKLTTLEKFKDDSKKYFGVDITIDNCRDFNDSDTEVDREEDK
ncbi:MAG: hypothetical protein WC343_15445 [Bacilli bacterium]